MISTILWITTLLFGSFQFGFDLKILEQSQLFIQHITEEEHAELGHWALSKLYSGTCSQNNIVKRSVAESHDSKLIRIYSEFGCGDDLEQNTRTGLQRLRYLSVNEGYEGLGIYILFKTTDPDERTQFLKDFSRNREIGATKNVRLVHTYLNERKSFDVSLISEQHQLLFYYALLYDGDIRSLLDEENLKDLLQQWIDSYSAKENSEPVFRSLQFANMIRLSFEINALPTIQTLVAQQPEENFFPLSEEKTRYLNAITYSLYVIGRFDQSLNVLRNELIPLADYLGLNDVLEVANFRKGVSLYSLGKFQEAKEIFESINTGNNAVVDKTELFNNLSICYFKLGEKSQYIDYQLTALNEARKLDEYSKQLIVLRNLFVFYTSVRDENTAQYYLDIAEQIARENEDSYQLAAIHSFSGTFHWEFNKNSVKALEELRLAQQQYDVDRDYFDYISAKKEEARILLSIDSLAHAVTVYERIAETATRRSNSNDYLEALIGLADIYILRNELTRASVLLEEIRSYPLDNLDFETSVYHKTVIASFLKKNGQVRNSQQVMDPVIEQIADRARNSIDSQSGLWTVEAEYVAAFKLYIDILLEQGSYARAIQVLDNLKTINDAALYNSPLLRSQQLTEEELARDKLLNDQIQKLRQEYLNASSVEEGFDIKRQIDRLSARREEIMNRIRSGVRVRDVDVWAIQRLLVQEEQILHFTELGDRMYISTISRESIDVRSVSFNKKSRELFQEAADLLASSDTDLLKLRAVFNHLELDEQSLSDRSKLLVVPDHALYRIPLGVFPVTIPRTSTSYGTTTYLLEKVTLEYYTSLNALSENHRINTSKNTGFSAYAISDFSSFDSDQLVSLPYTIQEVNAINNTLNNITDRSLYLGPDATKNSFFNGIQKSSIVHVATHSEVSEQDPLFSTVYLNSNEEPAKALHAYELFDVVVNSDLIMMNSCSSGSGGYLQGSGILGLTRVLRYAGAKSLGLNIWSVNDKSASDFATAFYTSMNNGESKSVSMRQAKLSLLYKGSANPYYWGAYMLVGNPEPLTKKPVRTGLSYLALLLVITAGTYITNKKG